MIRINTNHEQLAALGEFVNSEGTNRHFNRVYAELRYLSALSDSRRGVHDALLRDATAALAEYIRADGCVTAAAVRQTEDALAGLATEAKSFEYLCVSHAHIDMNWMWGYHETVAVTLATMRTMLDMMNEFPAFTFSQSQASVYRIVEEFAPAMFEEIRQRVREGRWEILASTWVECDKNMPSGESLTRHILYTKQYISEKFGIPQDDLCIDFEPDTFGHSLNVPEILNTGGVQYYYHCRGHIGEKVLYRWQAPSGNDIIVYTEPFWYNADIDHFVADYAPELGRVTGSKTLLKVYGVGDHGGGPTRRDISRLIEMNSWPLYPQFTFGRLRNYFEKIAGRKPDLPVLDDEINFLCDGCYTTQSRIKAGNRKAERLLGEAEFYSGTAMALAGRDYPGALLTEAWRKTLFNQFHDIIPGSGVTETREYASGLYQQVFAAAESVRTLALEAIAGRINTAPLFSVMPGPAMPVESRGEGAGVGYGQTGRGAGKERVYHVFNSLPYERREITPITVWDYEGDFSQIAARDAEGGAIPCQMGESGNYWGHHFDTLLAELTVPAGGYTSVIIEEKINYGQKSVFINDMRKQTPDIFVLENEYVKAVLNPLNGGLLSLIDKASGIELVSSKGAAQGYAQGAPSGGIFRLATEAVKKGITRWNKGMSAWFTGRYRDIADISGGAEITPLIFSGAGDGDLYGQNAPAPADRKILSQGYKICASFGNASSLEVIISLDAGSPRLRYDVTCDWREFGSDDRGVPNLHFYLPLNYKGKYRFDVPFGMTGREPADMDLPGESFVFAENRGKAASLALLSMDKYGFRCGEDSIALTLIRGAYDPDLTPETGRHHISFALVPVPASGSNNTSLARESLCYRHPFTVISGKAHEGNLAVRDSLLYLESGTVILAGLKRPEAGGKRLLFRVYEVEGKSTRAVFKLGFSAAAAYYTDATETKRLGDARLGDGGRELSFDVPPYSVRAVILCLK
ncbi:alpha-mannosidase [Spirochaetia bacterium]|nr:alpha-mannosidase [Spirochaetia bacterium]